MNIPVTEWFPAEVKPVHVGLYNASVFKDADAWRFWNGEYWSCGYKHDYDDESKSRLVKVKANTVKPIYWRGLTSPHPEWKP